jgi:hypothetical protein
MRDSQKNPIDTIRYNSREKTTTIAKCEDEGEDEGESERKYVCIKCVKRTTRDRESPDKYATQRKEVSYRYGYEIRGSTSTSTMRQGEIHDETQ